MKTKDNLRTSLKRKGNAKKDKGKHRVTKKSEKKDQRKTNENKVKH